MHGLESYLFTPTAAKNQIHPVRAALDARQRFLYTPEKKQNHGNSNG
jgi:hypothetical protein